MHSLLVRYFECGKYILLQLGGGLLRMENYSKENISRFHLQRVNRPEASHRITVSIWKQEFGPDIFPDCPLATGRPFQIIEHICRCILERDQDIEWIARFDLDLDLTWVLECYIHPRVARVTKLVSIFLILESDPGRFNNKSWLTTRQ